jgi:capsular exopolysaccharide synthesis family protein
MKQGFDVLRPTESQPEGIALDKDSKTPRYPADEFEMTPSVSIAHAPEPKSHIVTAAEQNHPVREHFRYLEHQLRSLNRVSTLKTLLVTIAEPREGKTVVAGNLATTLACGAPRVLLINADMRAVNRDSFGLGAERGLAEILEEKAKPSDVMVYLEALKVFYIPSGKPSTSPIDLLQAPSMRRLLKTVSEFDWVIVDSPPLGAFADALTIATEVDGVILVARSGLTRRRELEQSLQTLKHCRIAGVVLNASDRPKKDYYYSYYNAK